MWKDRQHYIFTGKYTKPSMEDLDKAKLGTLLLGVCFMWSIGP